MKKRAYKLQRFANGNVVTHALNTKTQLYKILYGIHKYLGESHITYGVSTLWHRPTVSNYIADNRKALGLPVCKKRSVLMNRIGANMTHLFNLAFIGRGKDGRYRLLSEWTEEKTNEPIVKILQDGVRGKTGEAKTKTKTKTKTKAEVKAKEATVMVVTPTRALMELTGEAVFINEEYLIKDLVRTFKNRISSINKNDCLSLKIKEGRLIIGIPLLKDCTKDNSLEKVVVHMGIDSISAFVGGTVSITEKYPPQSLTASFERLLKKIPHEHSVIVEIKKNRLTLSIALEDKELSDLMPDK